MQNNVDTDVKDLSVELDKEFGSGSIMTLGTPGVFCDIPYWVTTGDLLLDLAIGHGIPGGRLVEIHGDPSTGKSLLGAWLLANNQKAGGISALLDKESGFEPSYAAKQGVDIDNLLYSQVDTVEECIGIIESMIDIRKKKSVKRPLMILWDSVAATPAKAELENDFGDSHMALHARLLSEGMRRITGKIAKEQISLICINQIRDSMSQYGPSYRTLGGNAIPFHASVRIQLKTVGKLEDATKDVFGITILATVVKNKVSIPFKRAKINFDFDRGIVPYATWLEHLEMKKVILRNGGWYYIPKEGGFKYNEKKELDQSSVLLSVQSSTFQLKMQQDQSLREYITKLITDTFYNRVY